MAEEKKHSERKLDLAGLKGLAHPLRVEIFDALSVYGPATASGLAERLGESSGSTSYHLRQLERHGFVREVEGRGTARDRWWERMPGGVSLSPSKIGASPAGRAATTAVMRQWERNRAALLDDFVGRGLDVLPGTWFEASTVATANVRVTAAQLAEITESWAAWAKKTLEPYRDKTPPGSRPVQIHFNAFPVLDGALTETVVETQGQADP